MAWAEGRTEERDKKFMPCEAGEAISPYRIVSAGAAAKEVIAADNGTVYPIGVTGDASENGSDTYTDGDPIALVYDGVVYIEMQGTGNQDDLVMAYTGGLGVKHVNTDGVYILGHATQSWADGDVIPVTIDRYFIGDYSQSS